MFRGGILAAAVLLCLTGAVRAEPVELTAADLDTITAGGGGEWFAITKALEYANQNGWKPTEPASSYTETKPNGPYTVKK